MCDWFAWRQSRVKILRRYTQRRVELTIGGMKRVFLSGCSRQILDCSCTDRAPGCASTLAYIKTFRKCRALARRQWFLCVWLENIHVHVWYRVHVVWYVFNYLAPFRGRTIACTCEVECLATVRLCDCALPQLHILSKEWNSPFKEAEKYSLVYYYYPNAELQVFVHDLHLQNSVVDYAPGASVPYVCVVCFC